MWSRPALSRAFRVLSRSPQAWVAALLAVLALAFLVMSFVWPVGDLSAYSSARVCSTMPSSPTSTCRALVPGRVVSVSDLRGVEMISVETEAGQHITRSVQAWWTWSAPTLQSGTDVTIELWEGRVTRIITPDGSITTIGSPLGRQSVLQALAITSGVVGLALLVWTLRSTRPRIALRAETRFQPLDTPAPTSVSAAELARPYPIVHLDTPASAVASIFASSQTDAVLVEDRHGRLVAVLTEKALLDAILRRAASGSPPPPLEAKLPDVGVDDLVTLRDGDFTVSADMTILDVALMMVRDDTAVVGVMDGGRLIGGIPLSAVLRELVR